MSRKENHFKNEFLKHLGIITQLGLSVVLTIVLCVLGFSYFDRIFNAGGILMISGVISGVILSMLIAYRQLKKYYEN